MHDMYLDDGTCSPSPHPSCYRSSPPPSPSLPLSLSPLLPLSDVLDFAVPMEEIVRAFNWVIEKGQALYWGTSEWSAEEIEEAHRASYSLHRALLLHPC